MSKEKISGLNEIKELKKVGEFGKARGLMFRRKEKARALLFEFSNPTKLKIHSMFVGFPFLGIWLDSSGKIILKRVVNPWTLNLGVDKPFTKLIEIPINDFYRREIHELVGSQKSL